MGITEIIFEVQAHKVSLRNAGKCCQPPSANSIHLEISLCDSLLAQDRKKKINRKQFTDLNLVSSTLSFYSALPSYVLSSVLINATYTDGTVYSHATRELRD